MKKHTGPSDPIRRDVLKKAVFVAPLVLTLPAVPAFAQKGSSTLPPKEPKPIEIPKEPIPKEPIPTEPIPKG
jgi:hypothetical protein